MSPGFSSQWNSSQPAWNTYSFPRASLHYQSHASYTYCTGHPTVSTPFFCLQYIEFLMQVHSEPRVGISQFTGQFFQCHNFSKARICCCWVKEMSDREHLRRLNDLCLDDLCWKLMFHLKIFLGEIGWSNFWNGIHVEAECLYAYGFVFWLPSGCCLWL